MKTMKQTMKLPKSFFNYLMSNNSSIPKVGEFATIMHYSDRTVVIVDSVSEDGKKVVLMDCTTVASRSNLTIGHQEWKHTPNGNKFEIVWYKGAWRKVSKSIEFTKQFRASFEEKKYSSYANFLRVEHPDLLEDVYSGHIFPSKVVSGITQEKKSYEKIRILFGVCDYYYDWSF
jgi:hypothetical protein